MSEEIISKEQIDTLVGEIFSRIIKDRELMPFFQHLLDQPTGVLSLKEKQAKFLHSLFKGEYEDADEAKMRTAHKDSVQKGLNAQHFESFMRIFQDSMDEIGLPKGVQNQFLQACLSQKDAVLNL